MRFAPFTRFMLAFRREARDMKKSGYRDFQDWRMVRGGEQDHTVTDVKVGVDGKTIYYKVEKL